MPNKVILKTQKRKRAAQAARVEQLAGTKHHGESSDLHFIPGNSTPFKWHPTHARYRLVHRVEIIDTDDIAA